MRIYLVYILTALILLAITGCGTSQSGTVKSSAEREMQSPRLPTRDTVNRAAYNYFINGSIFEVLGEYNLANRQYEQALATYPESNEIRLSYANTFLALKNYQRALKEAQNIKSRDLDTWLLLSNCYGVLGQVDSLITSYLKIIELDSLNIEAHYRLGLYYRESNNIDSAIWAFNRLSNISGTYGAYRQLANLQIQAGYYDKAEENYKKSLEADSSENNVRSYLGLSAIYEYRGDMEKAKEYLYHASLRVPSDIQISTRLLQFYQQDNEIFKALALTRKLNNMIPNDFTIGRQLGLLLYEADSLKQADSVFSDLIIQGDSNFVNLYYLGRIALLEENHDLAKNYFIDLTNAADSIIDGWLNLALIYRLQDSLELEVLTYEKGLRFMNNRDDSIRIIFSNAITYERNGEFDKAVELFEHVIGLSPNHSQSLNYLGYMLADKGIRLEEARAFIEKALSIIPESGAYLDSYGWVLFKLGQNDEALSQLLLAYEQVSDDPTIIEHLGDVYNAMGDSIKAVLYWDKALKLDPDNQNVKEKLGQ